MQDFTDLLARQERSSTRPSVVKVHADEAPIEKVNQRATDPNLLQEYISRRVHMVSRIMDAW